MEICLELCCLERVLAGMDECPNSRPLQQRFKTMNPFAFIAVSPRRQLIYELHFLFVFHGPSLCDGKSMTGNRTQPYSMYQGAWARVPILPTPPSRSALIASPGARARSRAY